MSTVVFCSIIQIVNTRLGYWSKTGIADVFAGKGHGDLDEIPVTGVGVKIIAKAVGKR